jgi:putative NADH-flavin reductase
MNPTTLALFGATGQTGRRLVAAALARGLRVRALVRTSSARLPQPQPALAVQVGDARDRAAVAATLDGADAALVTLGMADITQPATDFSDAVATIAAAMQARAASLRRLLVVGNAGLLDAPGGGLRFDQGLPDFMVHIAAEHRRNLAQLRASALDWTLLCPLMLRDDLPPGGARWAIEALPEGSDCTGTADLAATMLDLLAEPASIGRRVGVVSRVEGAGRLETG